MFGLFSRGHTDTATVTVTLTGVNAAPTALGDTVTDGISEDAAATRIDVLANDTDPDNGATLTITGVTNGRYGDVAVATDGKSVTYTPNAAANALSIGETKNDTFAYTVSDGKGGTATATVGVSVTGANDPPVVMNETAEVSEDAPPTRIDVLANDSDPDATDSLTIIFATDAGRYGTLSVAPDRKSVIYSPNAAARALRAGETGVDTFTYTVGDGKSVAEATVTVTVVGVPDATVTQKLEDVGSNPTDVAVTLDGTRGFITNPDDGTVTVIEVNPDVGWTVGGTVSVGDSPGRIATGVDKAYVVDNTDGSLWVLDSATGWDVATGLDYANVADVRAGVGYNVDRAYIVDTDGNVTAIDTATYQPTGRVGL